MRRKKLVDPADRGRKGGKARLRTMTPQERTRRARHAALARHRRASRAERSAGARRAVLARWTRAKRRRGKVLDRRPPPGV